MKEIRKAPDNQSGGGFFPITVKLLCVLFCVLAFSYFSYLFNGYYLGDVDKLDDRLLPRYIYNMMGFLIIGALIGVLVALPAQHSLEQLHVNLILLIRRFHPQVLVYGSLGALVGMTFAVLAALPIYLFLPGHFVLGLIVVVIGTISFGYLGALTFGRLGMSSSGKGGGRAGIGGPRSADAAKPKVIDSSVIIDGRILALCKAGIIEGRLLIPTIVLNEIQKIADDDDQIRRQRGRGGLDLIEKLREESGLIVEIVEIERPNDPFENSVDSLLLTYAKSIDGVLVTNDYNLGKVAELRDVRVMNLNVLANTLRKTLLPGETAEVSVVKYGKEHGQGIAYLDDGTMIVIESGDKFIGENVTVEISSVMQTVAGRLIFAKILK